MYQFRGDIDILARGTFPILKDTDTAISLLTSRLLVNSYVPVAIAPDLESASVVVPAFPVSSLVGLSFGILAWLCAAFEL
jgi:hypothetical protein